MPTAASLVTGLKPCEVLKAEETLTLAFLRDPMARFLFGHNSRRHHLLRWIFRIELRYALGRGIVDAAENGRAVAVWIPPERTSRAAIDLFQAGMLVAPFAVGFGPALRAVRLLWAMRRLQKRAPASHWYLLALGVHPKWQGRGWGSLLLSQGLRRARARHALCYLETTNPANLGFYERHGLCQTGTTHLKGVADLSLWGLAG